MNERSALDHAMMTRALRLAARGMFTTRPNPRVGCVIASSDVVIGEGFHVRKGEAHAEVHALAQAGARARGATAYVTLEPCAHFGRTPPCANALIEAGVARVVCAIEDPFEEVAGQGIARLREAGIDVDLGLMQTQAFDLNRGFFTRIEKKRPWIRLKSASSLDGRIALGNGESKWITGEAARADVQRWRAQSCAILTGIDTVLADDPAFSVRGVEIDKPPLRVVLDSQLRIRAGAQVLNGVAPTLVFTSAQAEQARVADLQARGIEVCVVATSLGGGLDLSAVFLELAQRQINEVQVECGGTLAAALMRAQLVDEWLLYQAPLVMGGDAKPAVGDMGFVSMPSISTWRCIDSTMFGEDFRRLLRPLAHAN